MYKCLLVLLIILFPLCVTAQYKSVGYGDPVSKVNIGLNIGLGTAFASSEQITTTAAGLVANGNVKVAYNASKWQVGAGIDVGAATAGSVERKVSLVEVIDGDTMETQQVDGEAAKYATPYYSPHVFVNYKMNLPGDIYLYLGGSVGYTLGTHGFNVKPNDNTTKHRNVNGLNVGLSFGIDIRINSLISLEIYEGWRMSMLKEPDPIGYEAVEKNSRKGFYGNYQWWYNPSSLVKEYNAHILVTSIGLRFNL